MMRLDIWHPCLTLPACSVIRPVSQVLAACNAQYEGHIYFDSSMLIITFVCAGASRGPGLFGNVLLI